MTQEVVTLESLQEELKQAVVAGKAVDELIKITDRMKKFKAEIAKQEAERLAKEAEALAEVRKAAVTKLEKLIRVPDNKFASLATIMSEVKAIGFHYTYKVEQNTTEIAFDYATAPKQHRASGGGSSTGKSKAEYGMSLQEIVDKFGTDAEKEAIKNEPNNSKSWQMKVKIKKQAIEQGLLKPAK